MERELAHSGSMVLISTVERFFMNSKYVENVYLNHQKRGSVSPIKLVVNYPKPELSYQPILRAGKVFVQDFTRGELSKLYTIDLSTGKTKLIGSIAKAVTDIAFMGDRLYGIARQDDCETTQLIKIDPVTARSTIIGDVGLNVVGLAYNRIRNTLFGATAKQLIAIDLNTGKGTPLVTVANQDFNCGQLAFDRNGIPYITLIDSCHKKYLVTTDLYNGTLTFLGNIGFPNLSSIEFFDDFLYGVSDKCFGLASDGKLIRIDITNGTGTLITNTDSLGDWVGIAIYKQIECDRP